MCLGWTLFLTWSHEIFENVVWNDERGQKHAFANRAHAGFNQAPVLVGRGFSFSCPGDPVSFQVPPPRDVTTFKSSHGPLFSSSSVHRGALLVVRFWTQSQQKKGPWRGSSETARKRRNYERQHVKYQVRTQIKENKRNIVFEKKVLDFLDHICAESD